MFGPIYFVPPCNRRNSDPGSHINSGLYSPFVTTVRALESIFIAINRRLLPLTPSSTGIE